MHTGMRGEILGMFQHSILLANCLSRLRNKPSEIKMRSHLKGPIKSWRLEGSLDWHRPFYWLTLASILNLLPEVLTLPTDTITLALRPKEHEDSHMLARSGLAGRVGFRLKVSLAYRRQDHCESANQIIVSLLLEAWNLVTHWMLLLNFRSSSTTLSCDQNVHPQQNHINWDAE